jgi:hypothetical protein
LNLVEKSQDKYGKSQSEKKDEWRPKKINKNKFNNQESQ